jgi:hypothetical protein
VPTGVLQHNPPLNRFKYIAKTYGQKHPEVVLATFLALADTVGIERPESEFEFARRLDFYAGAPREETARELLREALVELQNDPRMKHGRESDALWPWLARELVKIKKANRRYDPGWKARADDVRGKGSAIALWQQQERIDLGQWRIPSVLKALEEFEVEDDDVSQGEIVYEFDDGWTVQQLETSEQLDDEGEAMQHCVGGYCEQVEHGAVEIFSLRDPKGRPHVTIEFDPGLNIVKQVRGKQNADPTPEYQERVDKFLASDALPAMDPDVKEIYDAMESETDEEEVGYLIREWLDLFNSGDALAWIKSGFGHNPREAETLHYLDVTPEDTNNWPAVVWDQWGNHVHGGSSQNEKEFVRLVQIATMINKLDGERAASGAAREFAKQIDLPFVDDPEQSPKFKSEWEWNWNYHSDEQAEWGPVLAEAEQWANTDLDLDEITGWYQEYFPPGPAEAWHEIGVSPEVASALRAERVIPEQVDRAVEMGRLSDRYPNELNDVDKILKAVGVVAANRRRVR